jgi:hypothetical protein
VGRHLVVRRSPVRTPLSCPGSLRPVRHLRPGAVARCDFCGATVLVIPPPTRRTNEPYPRSPDPRLERHPSVWMTSKE